MADQTVTRKVDVDINVRSTGSEKALNDFVRLVNAQARFEAQTKRTSTALVQTTASAGQMRSGMQNLGFQFQDLSVQIAGGQGAMRAFAQQLPQALTAVQSMMGGTSKLAAFLAGGWGTAFITAATVLVSFASTLFETEKKTDQVTDSSKELEFQTDRQRIASLNLKDATDLLNKATGAYNLTQRQEVDLTIKNINAKIDAAKKTIEFARAELVTAEARVKAIELVQSATKPQPGDLIAPIEGSSKLDEQAAKARGVTAEIHAQIAKLYLQIAVAEKSLTGYYAKGITSEQKVTEATNQHTAAIDRQTAAQEKLQQKTDKDFLPDYEKATSALEGYQQQAAEAAKEHEALNKKAAELRELLSNPDAAPFYAQISKDLDELDAKLDPALEKLRNFADGLNKSSGNSELDQAQAEYKEFKGNTKKAENAGLLDDKGLENANNELERMQRNIEKLNMTPLEIKGLEFATKTIDDFADNMAAAIEGTKSFSEAFNDFAKTMIRDLTKLIVKWAIFKALSSLMGGMGGENADFLSGLKGKLGFEKGGVFNRGRELTAFAGGGVVNGPTVFPMTNGAGLMGEAGPEAIMPLQRNSAGQLGVAAPPVNIQIINNAGVNVTTRQEPDRTVIMLEAVDAARKAISSDIRRGGNMVSRSIENAYGVGRGR